MKKKKRLEKIFKKSIIAGALLTGIFCANIPLESHAEQESFASKVVQLQGKFPSGQYWNHVGSTKDNSDGYTNKPCEEHKKAGVDHVYGTGGCTCNHFAGGGHLSATQCMGFANKLGYDVFGDTTWTKYSNPDKIKIANIKVGDIVRINGSHSVFVIARNGNNIMVGEANYPNNCQILWGRIINLNEVTVSYYEHANNYDAIIGTDTTEPEAGGTTTASTTETATSETATSETLATETPTTETPTTEIPTTETSTTETPTTETAESATTEAPTPYTGWKKTSDGMHYQYLKKDVVQKSKWLTVKGKKYYVDKNGYRVTGFYKISGKPYYFNSKGVLQKKKWITVDGKSYYVDSKGYVLKSQWLWKDNGLVYVKKDGAVAKNELVKIGSRTYYFNSKGKRSKGFKKCNGKYYYCNSSGVIQKKKWITKSGKTYYVQKNGQRVQNKLVKIGKYKYYFNEKGYLIKKKRITYKGKIYKADKKGRCKLVGTVNEEKTATTTEETVSTTEKTTTTTEKTVSTTETTATTTEEIKSTTKTAVDL